MKLSNFVPELSGSLQNQQRLSSVTKLLETQLQKSQGDTFRQETLGLENILSDWIRRQAAYRYQLIVDLYNIYYSCAEIRSPIHHIKQEVFRRGIKWKEKFHTKCKKCSTEYDSDVKECAECKTDEWLAKPDVSQKNKLKSFLDDSNVFDQSFEEVLKQFFTDINIVDDGFLYIAKEYYDAGDKILSKPIEIRHLHPSLIELDLDNNGLPKNKTFFCLIHRDEKMYPTPGKCEKCRHDLVAAMYIYRRRHYTGSPFYLTDSEIIHTSYFDPGEMYGFSPIVTIFEKVLSILGMDKMMFRYFYERKIPSSMIMVFTDDVESLRREKAALEASVRQNPDLAPIVAVSAKTNRGRVDMVRMFHTLQEMDYLPVRNEIRERIAAMWGVTPIWQGSVESLGGISAQTQQLTVMSRVVEGFQRMFHEKVFPYITDAFGITDWELELPQPEEKADTTRMALSQQKAAVASMLFQMGFDVKMKSGGMGVMDVDFEVSGEAKRSDMGMFGGGGVPQAGQEGPSTEKPPTNGNGPEFSMPQEQTSLQQMDIKKADTWVNQIMKKGYGIEKIQRVASDGSEIIFKFDKALYKALFYPNGELNNITKLESDLHVHGNYSPHQKNTPHAKIDNTQTVNEETVLEEEQ